MSLEQREIEAIYHHMDANGKPIEVVRTRPKGIKDKTIRRRVGYLLRYAGAELRGKYGK